MVKSNYNFMSWKDLIKLLDEIYWVEIVSQRWSHIKIRLKTNWKKTIIPSHREIAYWTFSWIIEQLWLDENQILLKK